MAKSQIFEVQSTSRFQAGQLRFAPFQLVSAGSNTSVLYLGRSPVVRPHTWLVSGPMEL